jgi:hypothetical protein
MRTVAAALLLAFALSAVAKNVSRFDGSSAEAFNASIAALEADMGDAAKLAFHMKLAQVRNTLAEQRGRPLTDAEFAAALDGKTMAGVEAMADTAPTQIQIDIETSDDT